MPQPLLDLGDIGVVRQGIGGGRRSQRVHAEAVNVGIDAHLLTVAPHDFLVHRGGVERFVQRPGGVVFTGRNRGRSILTMPGCSQIGLDQTGGLACHRHEADLVTLASMRKMQDAFPLLKIADPQRAEFFPAQTVIKQGGEDGSIRWPLRVFAGGRPARSRLGIAQSRVRPS